MRRLLILSIVVFISACVTAAPRQARMPFPENEYQALAKSGSATVKGQAFLKTTGGDVKLAAGNIIFLNPVTSYSMDWYEKSYLMHQRLVIADPRYFDYIKTQVADVNGRFTFKNVPPGEYFVTTDADWVTSTGYRNVTKRITVKDSEEINIDIARPIVSGVVQTMPLYASDAAEKLLIIKGLQIGMGAAEAKVAIDQALINGWSASEIDTRANLLKDFKPEIGTGKWDKDFSVGYKGILIKNDSLCNGGYYGGFISINLYENLVTQISFGGRLTNDLFLMKNITPDNFVKSLASSFNMPDFYWIPHGWKYESPFGYTILFKTDKSLDIKINTDDVQYKLNNQKRSHTDFK